MKSLSEEELLQTMLADFSPGPNLLVPLGDDASVVRPLAGSLVSSVDSQVEGVHFDLTYYQPEELGYRAVQVAVSDLAAMGATPRYLLISLGLRRGITPEFLTRLYVGVREACEETGSELVGGNLSRSPRSLFVDVTALGEAQGAAVTRSGAREGHELAVTGPLGWAAAGRHLLAKDCPWARRTHPELTRRALRPRARVTAGQALARLGVGAMLDLSDGLAKDSLRLAHASKVGVHLDAVVSSRELIAGAQDLGMDPMDLVLGGGEDYELLFSYPPELRPDLDRVLGEGWTRVGRVGEGESTLRVGDTVSSLESAGWDHSNGPWL